MDRTAEFRGAVKVFQRGCPSTVIANSTPRLRQQGDFLKAAEGVAVGFQGTAKLIERLSQLVGRKGYSNDPTMEINEVAGFFKADVAVLHKELALLQSYANGNAKGAPTRGSQKQIHYQCIATALERAAKDHTKEFQHLLQRRSEVMKEQNQRQQKFSHTRGGVMAPLVQFDNPLFGSCPSPPVKLLPTSTPTPTPPSSTGESMANGAARSGGGGGGGGGVGSVSTPPSSHTVRSAGGGGGSSFGARVEGSTGTSPRSASPPIFGQSRAGGGGDGGGGGGGGGVSEPPPPTFSTPPGSSTSRGGKRGGGASGGGSYPPPPMPSSSLSAAVSSSSSSPYTSYDHQARPPPPPPPPPPPGIGLREGGGGGGGVGKVVAPIAPPLFSGVGGGGRYGSYAGHQTPIAPPPTAAEAAAAAVGGTAEAGPPRPGSGGGGRGMGMGLRRRPTGGDSNGMMMQQQQQQQQQQGSYQQQMMMEGNNSKTRMQEAHKVEKMIGELGQMFSKFSTLVAQQEETVMHIEEDVLAAHGYAQEGQAHLHRYYHIVQGNRGMIIKIFLLLFFFIWIFTR